MLELYMFEDLKLIYSTALKRYKSICHLKGESIKQLIKEVNIKNGMVIRIM